MTRFITSFRSRRFKLLAFLLMSGCGSSWPYPRDVWYKGADSSVAGDINSTWTGTIVDKIVYDRDNREIHVAALKYKSGPTVADAPVPYKGTKPVPFEIIFLNDHAYFLIPLSVAKAGTDVKIDGYYSIGTLSYVSAFNDHGRWIAHSRDNQAKEVKRFDYVYQEKDGAGNNFSSIQVQNIIEIGKDGKEQCIWRATEGP